MEKPQNLYCRFCAEPKPSNKLLDLEKDASKFEDITKKLHYLNASHIDFARVSYLPKTVCFVCSDALNKAYEFVNKLREAQTILANLHTEIHLKSDCSEDDDASNFDAYFLAGALDMPVPQKELKEETPKQHPSLSSKVDSSTDLDLTVKVEPKDESGNSNDSMGHREPEAAESLDQSLNVQDLLDAAIGENPFNPNEEIYAKEVPAVPKKSVKTWRDYTWICFHCNNEFFDKDTLRSHTKEVHKTCTAFTCIDCREVVKDLDYNLFVNHIRKHRKSLRNLCEYCDIKTGDLAAHLKTHSQKSQHPCQRCGEILSSDEAYQRHRKDYNPIKVRKPRRKRGAPITTEDLTCKTCSKVYKNLNSLRDHTKIHTSDRKRNYTCDRCGKTFFNKGTLTTHIMAHDNIKPYLCKICKRSFLFPNMLRRHVEMHSGVKPFSCEQCGRCFRLQYQLNAHKIVHTDSLPYICQYCSKAFRFKQILKNHERQHTGAKPYSCKLCSMEFTNWSNYNKHMKRRHNLDTAKKKITPEGTFPVNPETGLLVRIDDPVGTEEWKNEIMIPGKRGKKAIKKESR